MSAFLKLPTGAQENLNTYQALLLKWQKRINLISPNTVNEAWSRHFEDSLQLLPLLPEKKNNGGFKLYDLGSGAGFPGLPIAICRPDFQVTLVESDQRKCSFLRTVSRETNLDNIKIVNDRIESIAQELPAPDIISARALASLKQLFDYIEPWARNNRDIKCVFPKGVRYQDELQEAQEDYSFECAVHSSQIDEQARILVISELKPKKQESIQLG